MIAVKGFYQNGEIVLSEPIHSPKKIEVIVTFLEDIPNTQTKGLEAQSFSFRKSRAKLKKLHQSLSDSVIEERRTAL